MVIGYQDNISYQDEIKLRFLKLHKPLTKKKLNFFQNSYIFYCFTITSFYIQNYIKLSKFHINSH